MDKKQLFSLWIWELLNNDEAKNQLKKLFKIKKWTKIEYYKYSLILKKKWIIVNGLNKYFK